jgi:hypothetical protein
LTYGLSSTRTYWLTFPPQNENAKSLTPHPISLSAGKTSTDRRFKPDYELIDAGRFTKYQGARGKKKMTPTPTPILLLQSPQAGLKRKHGQIGETQATAAEVAEIAVTMNNPEGIRPEVRTEINNNHKERFKHVLKNGTFAPTSVC